MQSDALRAPGWAVAHQGLPEWEELQINTALCATACRDRAVEGRTLGKDLWRDEMSAESAAGGTLHSGRFSSAKAQPPNGKLVAAGGLEDVVSLGCYWRILVLGAAAAVPFYHGVFSCSCTLA